MRKQSVGGTFYPNDPKELERYFNHFNTILNNPIQYDSINSRAIIVPHAGYIYSGFSANIAYKILKNSSIKNLILIGPSHKIAFEGTSICEESSYETPLGVIEDARQLRQRIQERFDLKYLKEAHAEHSTETQFPFIKYYLIFRT